MRSARSPEISGPAVINGKKFRTLPLLTQTKATLPQCSSYVTSERARLPVQLFESALNLLIFLFILYLFKKSIMTDKLIFVYMLVYPVVRFTLEFFRGDEIRGFLFGLSTSQWISILLFVTAIIGLTICHFRKKPVTE